MAIQPLFRNLQGRRLRHTLEQHISTDLISRLSPAQSWAQGGYLWWVCEMGKVVDSYYHNLNYIGKGGGRAMVGRRGLEREWQLLLPHHTLLSGGEGAVK
uniref:Uncharacterized protein n=1 Tax=Sphaerodactylus townsendi TaxID=933632 RepID=A0ACB8EHQ4_9SAUR